MKTTLKNKTILQAGTLRAFVVGMLAIILQIPAANAAKKTCDDILSGKTDSSKKEVAVYQNPAKPGAPTHQQGPGEVSVLGRGDAKEEADLKADAEVIAKVASDLGLAVPPHLLHLATSDQINVLATSGGHAAPHWVDGATVVNGLKGAMGVLEFVTPGCPTCRAYYSASTPREEQRSIIMHVAGHNDMSATSQYARVRPSDGPRAGMLLTERLHRAYREENRDQVSLFYQLLQSMMSMQDFVDGSFESPEGFKPAANESSHQTLATLLSNGKKPSASGSRPWRKTESVIQALSENLPSDAPQWQRDLISLYEQRIRVYPGTFQTKIMNEGWATLMMHILARHMPWTQSKDLIAYAQLLAGVTSPSLSNPYYVGYTGWDNLYKQFMARAEIKSLKSEKEKDREFIKWARKFYEGKNDTEWARVALDQHWIEQHKMFLYRQWNYSTDQDYGTWDNEKPYLAISRDWRRIQNHLIRKYIDQKYRSIPQISLMNPNGSDGFIDLVQRDIENQPLELTSAAKTLFATAQVMAKPIRLQMLLRFANPAPARPVVPFNPWFPAPSQPSVEPVIRHAQLEVYPDGRLELTTNAADVNRDVLAETQKRAKKAIDSYKMDLLMGLGADTQGALNYRWARAISQISDAKVGAATQLVSHAPTYSAAIREYLHMIELRLRASLKAAMNGQGTITPNKGGVSLKVLPETPSFAYDQRAINEMISAKPQAPVDRSTPHHGPFDLDDNGTVLGTGPQMPGDRFGKKKQPGQGDGDEGDGEGEGDGDGDGNQPGEGRPREGEGDGQGNGGGNGTHDLNIPLELYGEMLADVLELPNMRRTNGSIDETILVRRGSIRKTSGSLVWEEIMMNAINKARALRRGRGLPYDSSVPISELVKEALPLIEPSDYVVSSRAELPRPDFEAVLVVNIDMTGSMGGERIAIAKNLVFNLKALLAAKYKKVNIVYVGFSDEAIEMSEKDAFSKFMGGGTRYASATKKDKEILTRYPNSRFNKYVITIGDAETGGEDVKEYVNDMHDMSKDLQYAAFAATQERPESVTPFFQELAKLESQWPWHGKTRLASRDEIFRALKDLFPAAGKKEEK